MKKSARVLLVSSLGVVAVVGSVASVQSLGVKRLERRLGVPALTPFFGERIRRGMLGHDVFHAVPAPDRVEYFRRQDGTLVQRLIYAVSFARDYHVSVLYSDSAVTEVEFEADYLGPLQRISAQDAMKQIGVSPDGAAGWPRD